MYQVKIISKNIFILNLYSVNHEQLKNIGAFEYCCGQKRALESKTLKTTFTYC